MIRLGIGSASIVDIVRTFAILFAAIKTMIFFYGNTILDTRSSSLNPSAEDEHHFLIKGGWGDLLTCPLVLLVQ